MVVICCNLQKKLKKRLNPFNSGAENNFLKPNKNGLHGCFLCFNGLAFFFLPDHPGTESVLPETGRPGIVTETGRMA